MPLWTLPNTPPSTFHPLKKINHSPQIIAAQIYMVPVQEDQQEIKLTEVPAREEKGLFVCLYICLSVCFNHQLLKENLVILLGKKNPLNSLVKI